MRTFQAAKVNTRVLSFYMLHKTRSHFCMCIPRKSKLACLVNARVCSQGCACYRSISWDDVDDAGRDAGLDGQLAHPQRAQGRLLCHLTYAKPLNY